MMPKSVSSDWGYNWNYSASVFPPVGGGKRPVLIKLKEGPLFFASFGPNGLFGSLSFDDGETWTEPRLITDDGPGTPVESTDGSIFTMSADNAEPWGYLSVCQGRNGLIHLISSRQHYVFNMKYIKNDYVPSYDPNDLALFSEDWLKSDDYITQSEGTAPDGNDLLLHYDFNEESGNIAHDQSDNIYDGNVVGATNWQWPSYDDSGCLSFNDDTAIDVPPAVTSTLTDQVTVSVWLKGYNSSGRDNVVFETGAGGLYLRAIVPTIPLQVEFQAGDDVNDVLVWEDSNSADWEGVWRHYAFVKNGSNMRIYRDGDLVAEKTDAWPNLDGIQNQTFDIGAFIVHANDYKGSMDEFRIYEYALTDDEILYLAKTAIFYIPLDSQWDLFQDGIINFKDYAIMTQTWDSANP
jgi:hypothetical protein